MTTHEHSTARWRLGFWSLNFTQFQSAFNDNAMKFLVIYLIVDMGLPARNRDSFVLVVGALFALPFLLFSMTGGYLADRFSKRSVTIGTKWLEVGAMLFAMLALARGNLTLEACAVFLTSSLAALFGPSKYGLLPEMLPEKDLSWGNGVVELSTFLAAIGATVASGFLAFYFRGHQIWSGVVLMACTFLGLAASLGISRVPAANAARKFNPNPLGDLWNEIRVIRSDRLLSWAVVGNVYLWFLAALLQFTIVIYGHDVLRIDDRHISYLQAAVAIGIGLGSLATGYLSGGKIEYGLIPLGAVGMTIFGFLSAAPGLTLGRAGVILGTLGFFGGFYAVPLNALIQHRPDPSRKGGVIAAANLLSFAGVFLAAGMYFAFAEWLHLRADKIFLAGAYMTLAATAYAVVFLPDSTTRLILWFLTHTVHPVHVEGRDNIPERGPAFFITREITPLEAALLAASTDRPIRFLMTETRDEGAERTKPSLWTRLLRISRLQASDKSRGMDELIETTSREIREGGVVCLAGSESVNLLRRDLLDQNRLGELLRRADAPIVAVIVESPSGLSTQTRAPSHVTARFGEPVSPRATPLEVSNAVAWLEPASR